MPNYRRSHGTLVAATVATVTLDADYSQVEILNRGTVEIFVCMDGTGGPAGDGIPTVAGNETDVVPAGSAVVLSSPGSGPTVIKMISSGTPPYSVAGSQG